MQKLTKILGAVVCLLLLSLALAQAQDSGNVRLSVSHDGTVKEVLDVLCAEIDGSLLVRNRRLEKGHSARYKYNDNIAVHTLFIFIPR